MTTAAETPVIQLRNLGTTSAGWLTAVGIKTYGDLERVGAVEAFRMVRDAGFEPSLNLLYACRAALLGIHWSDLPADERARLRNAV